MHRDCTRAASAVKWHLMHASFCPRTVTLASGRRRLPTLLCTNSVCLQHGMHDSAVCHSGC
jgi:hypothetical protein